MSIIQAIILAIVEGLTEFLPISSTGHMVLTSAILGIENDKFTKLFEVCIQLGAILAVVALYWKKFFDFSKWQFYVKLLLAVIPALILGKLFNDLIDEHLGNPAFIATVLLIGGILLLFVDNWFKRPFINDEKDIDNILAIKIGMYQCLAIIFPGFSRSAATIIGGMQQRLTRSLAAEFSFFLAVPTMFAATFYDIFKHRDLLQLADAPMFAVGFVTAFVSALLAVRTLVRYVANHTYEIFAWYRIAFGGLILLSWQQGWVSWELPS